MLGDCTPGNREVFADLLHSLLDSTTFALVMLMDAAHPGREGQPPVLPPRCLAVLRATQLKPAVLLRFFGTVSAAAEAWMEARGGWALRSLSLPFQRHSAAVSSTQIPLPPWCVAGCGCSLHAALCAQP